jgi:hypothetical protein
LIERAHSDKGHHGVASKQLIVPGALSSVDSVDQSLS